MLLETRLLSAKQKLSKYGFHLRMAENILNISLESEGLTESWEMHNPDPRDQRIWESLLALPSLVPSAALHLFWWQSHLCFAEAIHLLYFHQHPGFSQNRRALLKSRYQTILDFFLQRCHSKLQEKVFTSKLHITIYLHTVFCIFLHGLLVYTLRA